MSKNKIAIFWHIGQVGNWVDIIQEQFALLSSSGLLYKADLIHLGINGPYSMPELVENMRLVRNEESTWQEETPTMRSLLEFAQQNDGYKILYMHTKGITHPNDGCKDWRLMMEYFCIEKWEEAISYLPEYDAVGTNYADNHYWGTQPHFSGGFWWATSEYIRSLDHTYLDTDFRFDREFWIGSAKGKMLSLHGQGPFDYTRPYPEHLYRV